MVQHYVVLKLFNITDYLKMNYYYPCPYFTVQHESLPETVAKVLNSCSYPRWLLGEGGGRELSYCQSAFTLAQTLILSL